MSIRGLVKKVLSADKNGIFAGTVVQCWALGPTEPVQRSWIVDSAGRLQFDSSFNALVYLSEAGAWQKLWNKFYSGLQPVSGADCMQ